MKNIFLYPFYILIHPFETIDDLYYYRKKAVSVYVSMLVLLLWVVVTIIKFEATGYLYNPDYFEGVSIYNVLIQTILVFSLWVVANWGFCEMIDGSASFKEIWVLSAYCLMPYILMTLINTLISNVLIQQEYFYIAWLNYIGIGWTAILIIASLKTFHGFFLPKTLGSIAITFIGMLSIVFIGILAYSLYQQLLFTFRTIYYEIILRI